jgi:two-component system, NarL family, sensor histidine kinase DevS
LVAGALDIDRLWRVIDVGRGVLSELDEDVVLDRVLQTAQQLTGARYAALGVLDEEQRELERFITRGITDEARKTIGELPRGRGVLGVLIESPEPLRLADVGEHPYSYGFPPGHPEMRTFLGVPILIGGRAWGNLYLTGKEGGGEFDPADEDAVVLLASWAAIAIDHARLHQSSTRRGRELERAVRSLQATREIALAVGGEMDLGRVLELVVKRGRALVKASSLVILLVDGEELVVAASAGNTQRACGQRVKIAESLSGEALRRGQAERIADVRTRLRISPERLGVAEASAALVVPMLYRGQPLGVLIAFDHGSESEFGGEHEELLRAFAASAAVAVATAQSVTAGRLQATLDAAEEERRRWGRELHDQTLQSLGGLRVALASARRRADLATWQKASEEMIEDIEREIENLRAIIADLRPPALDDIGLAAGIRALCERQHDVTGLHVRCRLSPPDPSLAPELETTVYRLVQEALTNIVKHARARTAQVEIHAHDDHITVTVRDDGVGFDTEQPTSGFGLAGLRERIALAHGQLDIQSDGDGTTVQARLPTTLAQALVRAS